ncbi:Canalicular multispecific organic anion transporter 1 [Orchesella cincta]|uniref:Canalicular multispecific organic anion transporter 1 n=1 Tax=Orchesella cincta TaxID=48709 RepID=A0A1D2MS76_ORCCI|nr:Canalicular multispecific organic anion transporter 1 [Orchesella cincta]
MNIFKLPKSSPFSGNSFQICCTMVYRLELNLLDYSQLWEQFYWPFLFRGRVSSAMDLEQEESDDSVLVKPPEKWPQEGKIDFEGVTLRYKDDASLVFNGVSFSIKSNEKIGIVGRTGAGKTSVFIHTLEALSNREWKNSHSTRPRFIPRKLLGTVTTVVIMHALFYLMLEHIHSTNIRIASVERFGKLAIKKLLGEKQLICLCRAMLRKNKITFDEATASLDIETDFKYKKSYAKHFQHVLS